MAENGPQLGSTLLCHLDGFSDQVLCFAYPCGWKGAVNIDFLKNKINRSHPISEKLSIDLKKSRSFAPSSKAHLLFLKHEFMCNFWTHYEIYIIISSALLLYDLPHSLNSIFPYCLLCFDLFFQISHL